jgi:CDP-paratose 2-epimerase
MLKNSGLEIGIIDITDQAQLFEFLKSVKKIDYLVHLAAQTSLLESIQNPEYDFKVNALGTINLLEYLRQFNNDCMGVFMASNKVYGNLNQFVYRETDFRFVPDNSIVSYDESLPVLPIGGYSISKSVSDYYVSEYGKRFSLPVISLRQSAVYGKNQNSRTDQGWVSFFVKEHLAKNIVNLRGNGKQVRDVLYIEDFVMLIRKLFSIKLIGGESYNVGGGFDFSLSILELFEILQNTTGSQIEFTTGKMSNEDQKYFVSDNSKISSLADWIPTTSPEEGISYLLDSLT